jgi:hypothetical protein
MAKLIYSAIASLDGYIADKDGNFEWAMPDEEVHTFINDLERFMRTFVAEGGDPRDAEEEWRRTRSKHAAQSERAKAEAARLSMYQSRMRAV